MQCNRPPRNCKEAFTAEGDQVFERRYYSSSFVRPKFLSQDVEAEIRLASCNVFVKSVLVGMNSGIVYLSICMYTTLRFLSEIYTSFLRILEDLVISVPFCDRDKLALYLVIFQLVTCRCYPPSRDFQCSIFQEIQLPSLLCLVRKSMESKLCLKKYSI